MDNQLQNNDHDKQDDDNSQEGDSRQDIQGLKGNSQVYNDDDDDDTPTKGKSTQNRRAGRRKINIEFIGDKSRRHITFSKRKAGIMKKAYELSTLTGTQVLLLVASETGHVYTFATPKLQPLITKTEGKNLIQACLNAPDPQPLDNQQDGMGPGQMGMDSGLPQQMGGQQGYEMDGGDTKKMRGDMKPVPVQQYSQSQQQLGPSPTPSQGGYGAPSHLPPMLQQQQYSPSGYMPSQQDFSQGGNFSGNMRMNSMGGNPGMSHMGNQYASQSYGMNPGIQSGSPIDNPHKASMYGGNMHSQGPHDNLNQYHQ